MDCSSELRPKKILQIAIEELPNFDVVLDQVSFFDNEDCDVLKFDVNLKWIKSYHNKLKEKLRIDEHYPKYHPHSTIAYLKKGHGPKYVQMFRNFKNIICTKKDLNYSLIQEI